MNKLPVIVVVALLLGSSILAEEITLYKKPWHVLGVFDGENAELEIISEYNINQLEKIESPFTKIVVVFDRIYKQGIPLLESTILNLISTGLK